MDIRFVVPPIDEQDRIIAYVEYHSGIISDTIQRLEYETSLVREYRNRLIADVVTGKLDVGGAELPEVEELDLAGNLDEGDQDDEGSLDEEEDADDGDD